MQKNRATNLELLRVVATLFVIILHYNNGTLGGALVYTQGLGLNYHMVFAFEAISICAVNIFVLLSGYFSCDKKTVSISKPFVLISEVVIFALFRYMIDICMHSKVFSIMELLNCFWPANWYVSIYIAMYLISPYLNTLIRRLSPHEFRTMLLVLFGIFSFWTTCADLCWNLFGLNLNHLSPISSKGSIEGYSIVNFVMLYFIGAYLRKVPVVPKQRIWYCGLFSVCAVCIFFLSNICYSVSISYCNPLVIIEAVSLFRIFESLSISSNYVNAIANCSFGVYLLHTKLFQFFSIERYVTGDLFLIPVHIIFCSIAIYFMCGVLYWTYMHSLHHIVSYFASKLNNINYGVNETMIK